MGLFGFLMAIISGALMSIQGVFNTGVTKQTSVWVASSFVQFTAFIVCMLAWYVTGREGSFSGLFKIDSKYMLLGGAIGAFITFTVIKSVGTLGPAKAIMVIVTSQLIVAYLIELLGIFGADKVDFQWRKLIGVILVIGGILTFKWE
ncbi:DMT family transporter [Anaerocolumna sp. AGMB13020]|uniref:DMT family transporter n=1 Tax=Anaerocolumna sp. AGMB13020 TaxID=3081750 RepID=UPI002953B261|nr:DMT family transporter [Anaerocolumna sp. AGMB13020]WOO36247.1 DMT family transporter [Anaerocolumna sp. AGMB13020]